MDRESATLIQHILKTAPPAFHFWRGKPQTGGFSQPHLDFIAGQIEEWKMAHAAAGGRLGVVETGAGLSTLLFMALDLDVVSFSLPDVLDKISAFLVENKIKATWSAKSGFSEYTVPRYFEEQSRFHEFALIDGNHAIPSVFADFIHLSTKLKKSGLLFVDDTQLPGPHGLCKFMENFPDRWRFRGNVNKLSCYEKVSDFGIDCGNHVAVKIFS